MDTVAEAAELADLFASLASHLKTVTHSSNHEDEDVEEKGEQAISLCISKFNRSLNLNDDSRVRVLDTVLSLMCIKAPQVFDTMIEYLVRTIVTVLNSSIRCEVLSIQNDEVLRVGSSIPCSYFMELIDMWTNVVEKLENYDVLSIPLICAVVKVAISTSCYQYSFTSNPILHLKPLDRKSSPVSKLLCHFSGETSFERNRIPIRLMFWYLDPLSLNNDISKILQESIQRPFLYLRKEFYERMEWHSILICLVLSPIMFIETRALLHSWFLTTGLSLILQFLIQVVSLTLDVISRPTWWGLSKDLGAKLPFSSAYFPYHNLFVRTLAGPLSFNNLQQLVIATKEIVSYPPTRSNPITELPMNFSMIDQKSFWALAINFPDWYYYASLLLFYESIQDKFHLRCKLEASTVEEHSFATAARYTAWILCPLSISHQDFLVDCLTKTSESWMTKKFGPGKKIASYRKKLKKPKFQNEELSSAKEFDSQTIVLWLKEFDNMYNRCCSETTNRNNVSEMKQNMLFRRIPLGILLGCSDLITDDGYELLLHYAATCNISQPKGTKHAEGQKDLFSWIDECNEEDVVSGACLVFHLTDAVESMAASLFETDERGVEFVYKVKIRVGSYLIKCLKRLIQLEVTEMGTVLVRDLCNRLVVWKHQGVEVLQLHNDLDYIISILNHE